MSGSCPALPTPGTRTVGARTRRRATVAIKIALGTNESDGPELVDDGGAHVEQNMFPRDEQPLPSGGVRAGATALLAATGGGALLGAGARYDASTSAATEDAANPAHTIVATSATSQVRRTKPPTRMWSEGSCIGGLERSLIKSRATAQVRELAVAASRFASPADERWADKADKLTSP